MKATLNGRPVEVTDFQFDRDPCDSWITGAYFVDTEVDLTDEELVDLTEQNSDLLYSEHAEHWTCVAEDWADSMQDR